MSSSKKSFSFLFLLFALLTLFGSSRAHAADPRLTVILPRGAARGTESEIRFVGARLADVTEIIFTHGGIEVLEIASAADKEVKVRIRIAGDCPIGLAGVYLRTATGITSPVLFSVGALREIEEPNPNHAVADAPRVELNTTINGVIENEDVDCFSFEAEEGQRLNFEVEGLRLGSSPLDPMLILFDPSGREVAAADDTVLLGQDCALGYSVPASGVYTIQVRESSYGGGGNYYYRLHMGTFPRPRGVFPPGGRPGDEIDLRWLGDSELGDQKTELPHDPDPRGLFARADGLISPSVVPFRFSDLENYLESEPNDKRTSATLVAAPGAFNGIIAAEGDADWFTFPASKGQVLEVRLFARRLRSRLDGVVTVLKADGGSVGGNDDSGEPDSYLRITAPEDGPLYVRVKDHLNRGGPLFYYRLEVTPVEPSVRLVVHVPGREYLPSLSIPKGNRVAAMLSVRRKDLGGGIRLAVENLPPGVTAQLDDVPNGVNDVPILFTADDLTTPSASLVNITGRSENEALDLSGSISQGYDLVKILNNEAVITYQQRNLPLAMTAPVPFRVEVVAPKVPLVRKGTMQLAVKVIRNEGFNEPIDLRLLWNPPGVGSGTARLEAGQTTTTLTVNANNKAPLREWKIVAIGRSAITAGGRGAVEVSSQLIPLSISEPWVAITFDKVRTEQGRSVELVAHCEIRQEFEGDARVELVGLPNKVSTTPQSMNKDTQEIRFLLDIPADAPTGRFTGFFARAIVYAQGEPVVHNAGGGEFRIDKPLPPKVKKEAPPKPDAPAAPTPEPVDTGPKRGDRTLATGIAPFERKK